MRISLPERHELQGRLDSLAVEHGVPGAVFGVAVGDDLTVCATGTTCLSGGQPVTEDTAFLIASITKPWTATLVLQLVDEGLVDLDAPVNRYLEPKLKVADPQVGDIVTVRQLLTHSAGFFGDSTTPEGRGDDALERIVASYATLPQLHRPGTMFSYCNAGYNVLGRLVECLTGGTWDEALRTRLVEPLGLNRTNTLPEYAMVHPVAIGHDLVSTDGLQLQPVKVWTSPRGGGPCGSTLSTTARDLLTFARTHMHNGLGPNGQRVLSEESAKLMRTLQIRQPDSSLGFGWSLGWAIDRPADPQVVGHAGNTAGQQAVVNFVPEHDLAVCVLTNGDSQGLLRKGLVGGLVKDLLGVELPGTPSPAEQQGLRDPHPFVGLFSRDDTLRINISRGDDGLQASFLPAGELAEAMGAVTAPLRYVANNTFLVTVPPMTVPMAISFVDENRRDDELLDEPATHVAMSLRVVPRV